MGIHRALKLTTFLCALSIIQISQSADMSSLIFPHVLSLGKDEAHLPFLENCAKQNINLACVRIFQALTGCQGVDIDHSGFGVKERHSYFKELSSCRHWPV